MKRLYTRISIDKLFMIRVSALLISCICCLYLSLVQVSGVDFWLQAKIGEIIVNEHQIPKTLLFPFTEISEEKFNAHEWLASVLFYSLIRFIGEASLPFVTALLGLVYFCSAGALSRLRSGGSMSLFLMGGICAIASENYRHVLRPELVSLILLANYWRYLYSFHNLANFKSGFLCIFLAVLWCNIHGSFILAPLIAGAYFCGTCLDSFFNIRNRNCISRSRMFWSFLLFLLVLFSSALNPSGFDNLKFVFGFGNNADLSGLIAEWMPTFSDRWLKEPGFWLGILTWLLCLLVLTLNFRRASFVDILLFVIFSILAFKAIRFLVYLGLLLSYLLPLYFNKSRLSLRSEGLVFFYCILISVVVLVAASRYGNAYGKFPFSVGVSKLSDGMISVLEDKSFEGNVLTSMELGAELIYRAYPRLKPSIDCRVDSYGMDYLRFQQSLMFDKSLFREFVRRYDVRYMLYERQRISLAMERNSWDADAWDVVYADRTSVFLRLR